MLNHPLKRYATIVVCFLAALCLLLTADLGPRGPRFDPQAAAKTDRAGTYDLGKARNLARVVGHIRAHYVDPERIDPRQMVVVAMMRVQATIPEVLVDVDRDRRGTPRQIVVTVDSTRKAFGLERVEDLYEMNWKLMDIFGFLERQLPPAIDLEGLEFEAINGVLSTLDPHSLLLSPRIYREMQLGQKGRFGGLGIVVAVEEGMLTIQSVMSGTPASEAGLQSGDQIVQIDADSTVNMTLNEAVNLLRGEIDSQVSVWVKRPDGVQPQPISMVRREIQLPSVDHEDLGDGVGYIHIRSFQENTADNLHDSLAALRRATGGLQGLVIDLRDNPGGLLDKAIAVSDAFLSHGTIVTTVREGARERDESHATRANTLEDLPLVVLVNKGSASASEIVAGALKRNDRAVILGETSFGKGSVQVVYKIDEAALKLTIAQYLTPGDVSIQSVGIVPDVAIETLRADGDVLDLHPDSFEAKGEKDLASHLDSARTIASRPSVQLRIVANGDPRRGKKATDRFEADALTLLAKDLLRAAPSPNRKQALVQAAGFLSQRAAEEMARLGDKLAGSGVDWEGGPNPARLPVEIALQIEPIGRGRAAGLVAGGKVRVTAAITNQGRRALHRIHGVLDSGIGSVDGVELAFGKIAPGATVKRTREITLPRSLSAIGDKVALRLFADGVATSPDGAAMVEVAALPQPAFAHSWQIVDAGGNGDGLIQRGETITLEVRVTNVGEGAAEDVLASIRNESGADVFIREGRQALGELAPGETKRAKFVLTVREALKARSVQLRLNIADQVLRTRAQDQLSPRVFPDGFPKREARKGVVIIGEAPASVRSGAHRDAPEIAEAEPRSILALQGAAGEWLEVAWPDSPGGSTTGWIASARAAVADEGAVTRSTVTPVLAYRPPVLELEAPPLITSAAEIPLKGVARFFGGGQSRRHMFVFRGDDKVFFQSAGTGEATRDVLAFDAKIPLEPGENPLIIYVREGEDHVTRHYVTIYRR